MNVAHIRIPVKITGTHPEGRVIFNAMLDIELAETAPGEIGNAAQAVLGIDWAHATIAVREKKAA